MDNHAHNLRDIADNYDGTVHFDLVQKSLNAANYIKEVENNLYRLIMRQQDGPKSGKMDKALIDWLDQYVENMHPDDQEQHTHLIGFDQMFKDKEGSLT